MPRSVLISALLLFAAPVWATELVMVEQDGCAWCARWDREIAEIYPKTAEGQIAPLRRMDLRAEHPADLTFKEPLTFTPTFVLVDDGQELARIEGYPGENFFWGLLEQMLRDHTTYGGD